MVRKFPLFIYIVIGLAVIGFLSMLIRNPSNLLLTIFVTVGIAFVLFLIVSAVFNRRSQGSTDEMRKYRQAVKQSKQKYQITTQGKTSTKTTQNQRKKRRRRTSHLTVIEGRKSIKKDNDDRASN